MPDTIDINITPVIETVTLTIQPNLTTINVNTVGGGGGSQDLQSVLDINDLAIGNGLRVHLGVGSDGMVEIENSAGEGKSILFIDDTEVSINGINDTNTYSGAVRVGADGKVNLYETQNGTANQTIVSFEAPIGTANIKFPAKPTGTYVFATLDDIPSVTGFVPYTGATTNVDLGEFELKAGQIELDTTPTGTAGVAVTRWNDTIGSSETTLKGGSVVLKNGVDLVARVVNKVTPNTTLTKAAYQVVRISGAQGQRLAVNLAQANNDNNSADTLGIVIETITTNQEGFIMTVGQLEGINTTGSLQGETWVDGDVLYLSPTTAGRITNIKPTGATGHIVILGYVEYAHAVNGKIYVKIMNGWELDELHNVFIDTPLNNQALTYESSTDLWKNKTIIQDSITDGVTTVAPSQNAVFDALALKSNIASPTFTGVVTTPEIALTSTTKGFLPNALTTTQRNAISSPTAGTMIFNTTEGYPEYFDNYWGWMPLYTSNEWKAKNGVEYFNDLSTSIGGDGMLTSGTASGTVSYVSSSISNRLGLGVLSTSTSATGRAWIGQGVSSTATIMRMGGGRIIYETSVRIPTLSTSGERFQFLSGLSSTNNGTSITNGILFAYDEGGVSAGSSASANWQVATMNGGTRTWTATSVPVVASQFYKLTIEINDACTSVVFKIDGTTVRTETLTLPSATDIGLMTQIYKSIGTTARTAELDYISFKQKFTTPR